MRNNPKLSPFVNESSRLHGSVHSSSLTSLAKGRVFLTLVVFSLAFTVFAGKLILGKFDSKSDELAREVLITDKQNKEAHLLEKRFERREAAEALLSSASKSSFSSKSPMREIRKPVLVIYSEDK